MRGPGGDRRHRRGPSHGGPHGGRGLSARAALETAVRDDWARLLALLVAQLRRLDLAEDALADAVEAAARTWPSDGVPAVPAAWLLTTARRRAIDRLRAEQVRDRRLPDLLVEASLTEKVEQMDPASLVDPDRVVDERLRLVLLCAHPSLPREHAAALTLRLVMGVPTDEIARLFLVPTSTMAARLTRARKRVAGETFDVPTGGALEDRVAVVCDVAYLAFTAGYAPGAGADVVRTEVAGEAVRLVRVLRELLPAPHAEVDALLALVLLQHSRRDARVGPDGGLVLLPEQDRSRWDHGDIEEALGLLAPLVHAPAAPYLLQALVAAEHAIAPSAAQTDWARVVRHYDELLALQDSPVVRLNRAVAVGEADGPLAGLAALEGLVVPGHRLPAVRAELLTRAGRTDEALDALHEALSLCAHGAEADLLDRRRAALEADGRGTEVPPT